MNRQLKINPYISNMKRFIFAMLFVLGAFVVKGFTSVCPVINTDNDKVNTDYSCDKVSLLSGNVLITEIELVTNGSNFVPNELHAINRDESIKELEMHKRMISGRNGSMPSTNSITFKRMIATGSGGLPYTQSNVILATY